MLLEPTQPPTWEHLPGLAQLREELQSNRAASKDEKGVPWERDWKPHPRLTAAMIDPPSEERLAEPGVADDPLELSLRLLTMAALQKRATKAWLAAKDAGMLRGGRGGGAGLGGMLRTGSTPMMRTSSQDMNLQHMADQVIAAMEKELHLDAVKCVEVMREHQTSLAVQLKAIGTIARIAAQSGREQERIVNGGALGATVAAMKAHKSSAELQRAGCVLFVNLCRTPLDGRTVGDEPMDLMDMVAHTPGKKLSDELSEVLKTPEVRHLDRPSCSVRIIVEAWRMRPSPLALVKTHPAGSIPSRWSQPGSPERVREKGEVERTFSEKTEKTAKVGPSPTSGLQSAEASIDDCGAGRRTRLTSG